MKKKEKKYFLIQSIDDLETRSLNVLLGLGGIKQLLEYYTVHKSFLEIKNCGRKSNQELTELCEYIQSLNPPKTNIDKPSITLNGFAAIELYHFKKNLLSTRAIHALMLLEKYYITNSSAALDIGFLNKYFIESFDFKTIKNIGTKTVKELNEFSLSLIKELTNPSLKMEDSSLSGRLGICFKEKLSDSERRDFISTLLDNFDFEKIFIVYFYYSDFSVTERAIINAYFFTDSMVTIRYLCKISGYHENKVKTFLRKIRNSHIPFIIKSISSLFITEFQEREGHEISKMIISISLPNVQLNTTLLRPNVNLITAYYRAKYATEFTLLDDIIKEALHKNLSFKTEFSGVLLSRKFVESSHFKKLLVFLNETIFEFERIGFEYNLEVLIDRLYKENQLNIELDNLKTIYQIITIIKRTDIDIDYKLIKSLASADINNRIIEFCENYLKQNGIACETKYLMKHLKANGLEINRGSLLKLLNNNFQTFIKIGNNGWGLKSFDTNNFMHGSLVEIVTELLSKSKVPLHISELVSLIGKYRKVNEYSLLSNLKQYKSKGYVFFNCQFIGLSTKVYKSNWYELPNVKAQHFSTKYLKKLTRISKGKLVEYMVDNFNYPKVHVEYLLNAKSYHTIGKTLKLDFGD